MIPLSGRVPGRASDLPQDDGGGYGLLSGTFALYLGFSRRGDYIGERAESEAVQGSHTLARRGQGATAPGGCGGPMAPLQLIFGLLESSSAKQL